LADAPADSECSAAAREERPADRLDRGVSRAADGRDVARTPSADSQDDIDGLLTGVLRYRTTGPGGRGSIAARVLERKKQARVFEAGLPNDTGRQAITRHHYSVV